MYSIDHVAGDFNELWPSNVGVQNGIVTHAVWSGGVWTGDAADWSVGGQARPGAVRVVIISRRYWVGHGLSHSTL